jgi:uncharacterized protein
VGVVVLAAYLSRRPVAAYLGLLPPRANGEVIGTTIATLLIPTFMFTVVGASLGHEFEQARPIGPISWPVALLWIFTAIITPVFEELLFRGFLYRGLSESRLGVAGAVLVTAILFGPIHAHKLDWFDQIHLVAMGLGYGCLRASSGSVWLSIVVHGLVNGLPGPIVKGH